MRVETETAERAGSAVGEWGLLADKPYACPLPSIGQQEVHVISKLRHPTPSRVRPRSAIYTVPPPGTPSYNWDISQPILAYIPQSLDGVQSLDAIMYHDLRTTTKQSPSGSHRSGIRSTPAVSSPLAKGVYTIYEAPPTPPESPAPSLAEQEEAGADETDDNATALRNLPMMKILRRAQSSGRPPIAQSESSSSSSSTKSRSSSTSSSSTTSKSSLASRNSDNASIRSRSSKAASPPAQEAKWLTEVGPPTFSRYQLRPGVILPTPAAPASPSSSSKLRQPKEEEVSKTITQTVAAVHTRSAAAGAEAAAAKIGRTLTFRGLRMRS